MAFQTSRSGVTAQINMTPMIDVLLVLLIIFMVIAPTHSQGLPAGLSQPALNENQVPPQEQSVVLEVSADGSLLINRTPVPRDRFAAELARIFNRRGDRTLFLRGDGSLDFRVIADAVDTARGAGVDRIALLTSQSGAPALQ